MQHLYETAFGWSAWQSSLSPLSASSRVAWNRRNVIATCSSEGVFESDDKRSRPRFPIRLVHPDHPGYNVELETPHVYPIQCLEWSPDHRFSPLLLSADSMDQVVVWGPEDANAPATQLTLLATFAVPMIRAVKWISYSPQFRPVVSRGEPFHVRFTASPRTVNVLPSTDMAAFLTVSIDGTFRLHVWDPLLMSWTTATTKGQPSNMVIDFCDISVSPTGECHVAVAGPTFANNVCVYTISFDMHGNRDSIPMLSVKLVSRLSLSASRSCGVAENKSGGDDDAADVPNVRGASLLKFLPDSPKPILYTIANTRHITNPHEPPSYRLDRWQQEKSSMDVHPVFTKSHFSAVSRVWLRDNSRTLNASNGFGHNVTALNVSPPSPLMQPQFLVILGFSDGTVAAFGPHLAPLWRTRSHRLPSAPFQCDPVTPAHTMGSACKRVPRAQQPQPTPPSQTSQRPLRRSRRGSTPVTERRKRVTRSRGNDGDGDHDDDGDDDDVNGAHARSAKRTRTVTTTSPSSSASATATAMDTADVDTCDTVADACALRTRGAPVVSCLAFSPHHCGMVMLTDDDALNVIALPLVHHVAVSDPAATSSMRSPQPPSDRLTVAALTQTYTNTILLAILQQQDWWDIVASMVTAQRHANGGGGGGGGGGGNGGVDGDAKVNVARGTKATQLPEKALALQRSRIPLVRGVCVSLLREMAHLPAALRRTYEGQVTSVRAFLHELLAVTSLQGLSDPLPLDDGLWQLMVAARDTIEPLFVHPGRPKQGHMSVNFVSVEYIQQAAHLYVVDSRHLTSLSHLVDWVFDAVLWMLSCWHQFAVHTTADCLRDHMKQYNIPESHEEAFCPAFVEQAMLDLGAAYHTGTPCVSLVVCRERLQCMAEVIYMCRMIRYHLDACEEHINSHHTTSRVTHLHDLWTKAYASLWNDQSMDAPIARELFAHVKEQRQSQLCAHIQLFNFILLARGRLSDVLTQDAMMGVTKDIPQSLSAIFSRLELCAAGSRMGFLRTDRHVAESLFVGGGCGGGGDGDAADVGGSADAPVSGASWAAQRVLGSSIDSVATGYDYLVPQHSRLVLVHRKANSRVRRNAITKEPMTTSFTWLCEDRVCDHCGNVFGPFQRHVCQVEARGNREGSTAMHVLHPWSSSSSTPTACEDSGSSTVGQQARDVVGGDVNGVASTTTTNNDGSYMTGGANCMWRQCARCHRVAPLPLHEQEGDTRQPQAGEKGGNATAVWYHRGGSCCLVCWGPWIQFNMDRK